MILIDANALVILLIGLVDVNLLGKHKRASIYNRNDFYSLLTVIGNYSNLVTLPNVWTEVDNILNNFSGNYKYNYLKQITGLINITTEKYIESKSACQQLAFTHLGLTDILLLEHARACKMLITSDSRLSDYAVADGINVYDLVKRKNNQLSSM